MGDGSASWACERGPPVAFRVGATGFGVGAGCGVGVGFGTPLNVGPSRSQQRHSQRSMTTHFAMCFAAILTAGVPVLGSAVSGIAQGAGRFRPALRGLEARLLALLPAGAAAGAGCGVGVGYGFGAGLFLTPSAGAALARRATAVRDALLARLPANVAAQLAAVTAEQPRAAVAAAAQPQRATEATQTHGTDTVRPQRCQPCIMR